jgi:uncharacterized repeat protein (TIGR03803 family)
MALPAQTFTVLYDFCSQVGCMDGRHPFPALMQGPDGNLYGGVCAGGLYRNGTIFKLTPDGQVTTLHNFCPQTGCPDGAYPYGSFLLGIDGNIYGAAWFGGTAGYGTLFKMTPSGQFTTLHTFCLQTGCPDGEYPWGYLSQDDQGNIYGTASAGGSPGSEGTVFRLAPTGQMQVLHTFCDHGACPDGRIPNGTLILQPGGVIYGTTQSGGAHNEGTVFSLTAQGGLTTLYNFCSQSGCADGAVPNSLVLSTDGNFYGVASQGGARNRGTFFKMSPAGQFVTVYSFCSQPGCADGSDPWSLIQGTDGNFYGIAEGADGPDTGTIFEITPSGSLTVLHTFCSAGGLCSDGWLPSNTGLVQHTNGNFYGTVSKGGNLTNAGTAFSLSTGLAPFVMTVPVSGNVGAAVQILGTNLTGATSVSFNGKAAAFTVVSSSEITANVPAGAATGLVRVATPGGVLSSNVSFRVLP